VTFGTQFVCGRPYKDKKFGKELIPYFPGYDTDRIENYASNSSIAYVFVAALTFLPSRYVATIGDTHNAHGLMEVIYEVRR
jgi:hypothetical protein